MTEVLSKVSLSEVVRDAQSGFASGQRDPDGTIQVRMNNVTTEGAWDWSSYIRVPIEPTARDTFALQSGDVVFNNTNSTELVGKTALFTGSSEPIVFSNHFTRLRTDVSRLEPAYLAYWLVSLWKQGVFARICDKWIGQSAVQRNKLLALQIPLPTLRQQKQTAKRLREQLAEVERARAAVEEQLKAAESLVDALLRASLSDATEMPLHECLREVTEGIGADWAKYPVLGATRSGLAPAKEGVGKNPQRYKPVRVGTIFYNPMRILLGSIAMVDEGETIGITSPDYVAMTGIENKVHPRWFYYWFRSKYGAEFIKSMSRGAVRERLLFKRLAPAKIKIPEWKAQEKFAAQMIEIRKLRTQLRSRLETLEKIPAALLREAFGGKIS